MLYIDGISLSKIKDELDTELKEKKINKISQTSSLAITLSFGKKDFILSCFPTLSICYVSDIKEEKLLEEQSSFSLNLKKYILGSTLINIEQLGFDRILIFTFSKLNELGEIKNFKLYFEMMGKHSNLILATSEDKIIDSIKKFSIEKNSNRVLFFGSQYDVPNISVKKSVATISEEEFNKLKNEENILNSIEGIGKTLENNIKDFKSLTSILNDKISPKIYFNKNDEILLATVLNIEPKSYDYVKEYSSFSELINFYLSLKKLSNTFKLLKDKLISTTKKELKKSEKIIKAIKNDLEEKKYFDRYREMGDILAASLHLVKKGMKDIELFDFYNNTMCVIQLDPLLSPQSNLEKIYKQYNKMKKGITFGEKRFIEIQENLKYFLGVNSMIENSDSIENLKLIEEELIKQNFIKISTKNKKNKNKISKSILFKEIIIDNVKVKYGRNNIENDELTTKVAHREDMWFHCKDIPGIHAVVNHSEILNDETIYNIAVFCAKQSRVAVGTKLTIDYTKIKYLNKPKGGKPGFVTYRIFNSILVTV